MVADYKDYQLFAIGSDLKRIGLIEGWTKLDVYLRFNDVANFAFDAPIDLIDTGWLEFGGGVEIMRNGQYLTRGIFLGFDEENGENNQTVTPWGADQLFWIKSRLAYPVVTGPPFTSQAYDSRTGAAGDILIDYVDYNAGPNATGARQITGLTMGTKLGVGSSFTQQARFENLLELCQEIALKGGDIGFSISDAAVFASYLPSDKSGSVKFSKELGNLLKYKRKVEMPKANYIVAGGQGEGTARTFIVANDSASETAYGRVEWFYDYRNAADSTQLTNAANGKLAEFSENVSVEIWPIEIQSMAYEDDYGLGDKVTVVLPSQTIVDYVREVQITLTKGKAEQIVPVIGTPGSRGNQGQAANLYARTNALAKRLNLLERR